ncbi:MAG: hypothetical protein RIT15_1470 [Pseudomonadota bacterium]|jgi:hypothetical protein
MSKSIDTPHETNLYTEYLLVDAFEEKNPSADFFALMMLLITTLKTILNALRPALKPAPSMACGRLDV